jgi:hypothetical protein
MGMGQPPRTNCRDCNVELRPYNKVKMGASYAPRCYDCTKIHERKRYVEGGGKDKVRERNMKESFGLTIAEYDKLVEIHQNGCAICRRPDKSGRRLAVDHNHVTNEIRGLLCHNCNIALGLLEENETFILNMIEYLKRTTWKNKVA